MNLPTWFNCPLVPEVHVDCEYAGHQQRYICVTGKCAFALPDKCHPAMSEILARHMRDCCVNHCQAHPDLSFYGIVQGEG